MRSLRQDSEREIQSQDGWGGILLNVSSLHGKRWLFCGLRFSDHVGLGWGAGGAAAEGGGFSTKQRRRLGFASARSALQEENLEICSYAATTTLLPKTAQECKGSFEASQRSSTLQKTCTARGKKRCFRAEISGWGAVCVLGQTCPSFWHEGVLSDSDWATDQDHSLLSPLLPPQSSPTHDMCHCHRSALEDMTSWRSGQIPKAEKRGEGKKKKLIDTSSCTPFLLWHRWTIWKVRFS